MFWTCHRICSNSFLVEQWRIRSNPEGVSFDRCLLICNMISLILLHEFFFYYYQCQSYCNKGEHMIKVLYGQHDQFLANSLAVGSDVSPTHCRSIFFQISQTHIQSISVLNKWLSLGSFLFELPVHEERRAEMKELFAHVRWTKFTMGSMDIHYNNACVTGQI